MMNRRTLATLALLSGLPVTACIAPPGDIGELPSDTEGSTGTDSSGETGMEDADGSGSDTGLPPSACGPDGPDCIEDADGDCVGISEDNAPNIHNPDQGDLDGDDIADVQDSCPSVLAVGPLHGDSDDDGVGNECDTCRSQASQYNIDQVPGYMEVRNIPSVADADGDGIGDACDNCVLTPNCGAYGPDDPWQPGDPIDYDDPESCQIDTDNDMIGDACTGMQLPGAAGVVGFGDNDDFDQDGLNNLIDACPRSPLPDAIACKIPDDCPDDRECEIAIGLCDHRDLDGDGVGDICDTCVETENPLQVADGAMDDLDGDFIGNACESHEACETRRNPARTAFYPVSVGGWCCTTQYPGDDALLDPDGLPIVLDCTEGDESAGLCRRVPNGVRLAPGMVLMPTGCEAALAEAGLSPDNHVPLTPGDVGGLEALWSYSCRLPPLDQDFDGLADACDLCNHAFDPSNAIYIDEGGMAWPDDGAYCSGAYSREAICGG